MPLSTILHCVIPSTLIRPICKLDYGTGSHTNLHLSHFLVCRHKLLKTDSVSEGFVIIIIIIIIIIIMSSNIKFNSSVVFCVQFIDSCDFSDMLDKSEKFKIG